MSRFNSLTYWLWRHKFWTAGACLGLVVVVFLIWKQIPVATQKLPSSPPAWSNLGWVEPKKTTVDSAKQTLGDPQYSYTSGGITVLNYPSDKSNLLPDRLYVQNGVVLMRELFFDPGMYKLALATIKTEYGEPNEHLYWSAGPSYNDVYLYYGAGMAVYVRPMDNYVVRIQYFDPNSRSQFMKQWGKDLQSKEPTATIAPDKPAK